LEDGGIPARVIDRLMGHRAGRAGARSDGGHGSLIGASYWHVTPEMQRRVLAAIEDCLTTAQRAAGRPTSEVVRLVRLAFVPSRWRVRPAPR
jgi:hypothetical protein